MVYFGLTVVGIYELCSGKETIVPFILNPGGVSNLPVDGHIGGAILFVDRAGVVGKAKLQ